MGTSLQASTASDMRSPLGGPPRGNSSSSSFQASYPVWRSASRTLATSIRPSDLQWYGAQHDPNLIRSSRSSSSLEQLLSDKRSGHTPLGVFLHVKVRAACVLISS